MKVTLVNYTQDAKELLIFSKKTRLLNNATEYTRMILDMSDEEKEKELAYVFGTIGSSLEFVDYTFMIEGVTRAFTHQLVRHRVGTAFAQQSQRTVEMKDFEYLATGGCKNNEAYQDGMEAIQYYYDECIDEGAKPEDARGLLPTNILTNILFKTNLRTLSGIMGTRLCVRTQGEFQEVAKKMRDEVLEVHPEFEKALRVYCGQTLTCCFPNFKACPVKPALPPVSGSAEDEVMERWNKVQEDKDES